MPGRALLDLPAGATERYIGHRIARLRRLNIARKPPTETSKPPPRKASGPILTSLAEAARAPGTPRKKAAAAGPRRRVAARSPAEPELLQRWTDIITGSLEDDKGEDIVVLDLTGRASFADRMVIATGVADRQISAMATHLEEKLGEAGLKRVLIEGANGSDWVLIDAGDIVIHLFKREARALYALERMWGADLDEALAETQEEPDVTQV